MNSTKCYLLIGNSRWHWAIYTDNNWEFIHTSSESKESKSLINGLVKWASVGRIPNYLLLELDPEKQIKLNNIPIQKAPQWLGIDRALAAWGAYEKAKAKSMHSKGLIIADAGTVLSLTCITSKGEFSGGQLVAGLNLQRLAMVEKTHKLKQPKHNLMSKKFFPISTDEAILRGSFQSLVGTLIEAQKIAKMPIWLCGGDSEILFRDLKKRLNIYHCPNIILETMINLDQDQE